MKAPAGRFQFGDVACSPHDVSQLIEELRDLLGDKALLPRIVLCLNAHIYNLSVRDSELRRRLNSARICAADGMSVVWAAQFFGAPARGRCNMTDAFHAFLGDSRMPGVTAVLMGCSVDECRLASDRIVRISPRCRILGSCPGYLADEEYLAFIARHKDVDMILLGMGTPESERVAEMAADASPRAVVWHIGGGTIRILAGTVIEAPRVWRRLGMQWLHRLLAEPIRLWKRYLIGNPMFVMRALYAGIRGQIGRNEVE